ncbi:TetR family transcriptional regulator [Nocardia mangyaensis]|uniref:TetR family transcriptional regulator n=1 Tax=Nocardia mangyaensis TaxID=2213200 RepID=A0A1J0VSH5_9NOCA|nr:TetR/AcrR family transcriptional regulator [Nocardia mangyaensis]APE34995.1 TetR family transcriptional regulator [Nocardia mangyaensis]
MTGKIIAERALPRGTKGKTTSKQADEAPSDTPARTVRRRPKNRRAQIAAESAAAFGAHGYHGVSMDDIARRLDISSTALYRHFPSKYALFREELLRLSGLALSATTLPAEAADWTPRQRVDHVLDAIISHTIANRPTVALVRWERRYLEPADFDELNAQFTGAIAALRTLLGEVRPELSRRDRAIRAVSIFAVVSSIGDHHATVPVKALSALLTATSWTLIDADLDRPGTATRSDRNKQRHQPFKHDLLLRKAVELFHERGYPNVSVEDIAIAAELSAASAVYRYYRSKSDLLVAAFRRAADRVSAAIAPAIVAADTPADALATLIGLYVAGSFDERALTFVYYAEFSHVDHADQVTLRHLQQLIIAEWAKLVVAARPELSMGEARILVHAAFSLVVDLGRAFGDDGICPEDTVTQLLETILLGRPLSTVSPPS